MSEAAQQQTLDTSIAQGGEHGTPVETPQTWPSTWREELLGGQSAIEGNEAAAKEFERLKRMSSPGDLWKSYRNLEAKLSTQQPRIEYDPDMPENKLAEWRKQEGIPASPKDYKLEFEDGLVVGELDQPKIDSFLEFAHQNNIPESHVKSAVKWYIDSQSQESEGFQQKVADQKHETLAMLKAEWGPEFTGNINAIGELFVDNPEIKDILMGARGADGLPIGNNDQVVRWAVNLAKQINPAATFTLPGGEGGVKGLENRIKEIETMMRKDPDSYYKDQSIQKEYEDLLDKQERLNSKK